MQAAPWECPHRAVTSAAAQIPALAGQQPTGTTMSHKAHGHVSTSAPMGQRASSRISKPSWVLGITKLSRIGHTHLLTKLFDLCLQPKGLQASEEVAGSSGGKRGSGTAAHGGDASKPTEGEVFQTAISGTGTICVTENPVWQPHGLHTRRVRTHFHPWGFSRNAGYLDARYSEESPVLPFTCLQPTRQVIPLLLHTNTLFYISILPTNSKNSKKVDSESKCVNCRLKFSTQVSTAPLANTRFLQIETSWKNTIISNC